MMEKLLLKSPAKVNLRLEIHGKREDGYHELKTVLQKISLHDRLHISLQKKKGIHITTDHPGLPTGRRNLVDRAARSILKRSDYRGGVDIWIEKRIPLGAGLGGGSSNAAIILLALNQLLEIGLSERELREVGVEIGADVPFFLFEGDAIGTGVGERLRKITLPDLWYILIYPGFEVSTRWAYENFVLTKSRYHINLHKLLKTPKNIVKLLLNDLESTVAKRHSDIGLMKGMLVSAGATGAMMTGSGPTVFGLFPGEEEREKAYRQLKERARRKGWEVFKAHSIP